MISLTCTSCQRSLEIDDAFAGGVCRCQFCGTIQTVPANLKKGGRPATPVGGGGAGAPQKALYQRKTPRKPADAPMTGAAATADAPPAGDATAVAQPASSGDSPAPRGARAAEPTAPQSPPSPGLAKKNKWVIGIALGAAAALAIGAIAWMAT